MRVSGYKFLERTRFNVYRYLTNMHNGKITLSIIVHSAFSLLMLYGIRYDENFFSVCVMFASSSVQLFFMSHISRTNTI